MNLAPPSGPASVPSLPRAIDPASIVAAVDAAGRRAAAGRLDARARRCCR